MIEVASQRCYKIGPFRVSINFDDEELAHKVTDQLIYVCPTVKDYEISPDSVDCQCFIFLNRAYHNPFINKIMFNNADAQSRYCIKEGNHYVGYSADLRSIEVFLDKTSDTFPYVFGHIWNLAIFMPFFLKNNAIILHAAGVVYKGKGFIFAGPSGIGKTTISKALLQKNAEVLSDERILIHNKQRVSVTYPLWIYSQEGRDFEKGFKESIPLKAIFFLEQGKEFVNKELNFLEKVKKLYQHATLFYPGVFQSQEDIVSTICDTIQNIHVFQLFYDRSDQIFPLLESFL